MNKVLSVLLCLFCFEIFAQHPDKKYTYIIVPIQYNFSLKPNQYQLNVLTRVQLKKEGFKVYMNEGEQMPDIVAKNSCISLKANVKKESSLFLTKIKFQLYDCFGKLVHESIGTSREKSHKIAYKEALVEALQEFSLVSNDFLKQEEVTEYSDIATSIPIQKEVSLDKKAIEYRLNNTSYWLLQNEDNYTLYLDIGKTAYANLNQADRGTYAYESDTINGAAYFTPEGNIIVEYLEKNKEGIQTLIFTKR